MMTILQLILLCCIHTCVRARVITRYFSIIWNTVKLEDHPPTLKPTITTLVAFTSSIAHYKTWLISPLDGINRLAVARWIRPLVQPTGKCGQNIRKMFVAYQNIRRFTVCHHTARRPLLCYIFRGLAVWTNTCSFSRGGGGRAHPYRCGHRPRCNVSTIGSSLHLCQEICFMNLHCIRRCMLLGFEWEKG